MSAYFRLHGLAHDEGHLHVHGAARGRRRGDFYQILDAPAGHVGQFAAGNVAAPWHVRYTATAADLFCQKGTVLVFR